MDIEDILSLTTSYSDKLYKLLKFDKIVNDYDFVKKLATDKAKMGLGWLKDIRFYERFIKDIQEKYKNLNIKKIRQNIYLVEHEEIEFMYINYNLINYKEFLKMKFDIVIMNPPYDGSLHLKILEKVIPIADNVISISPIDWLMNPYGGSVYNQFKHLKFNSIENVGLIKNIFNLDRASYTGGIYTIDKNANLTPDKFLYKFISVDFKNYIDEKILSSIIKKTIDCDNLENHIVSGEINDKTKYTIVMPKLVGNPGEKTYKLYVRGSRWDKIFYKGLYKGKTASETKKKLKNVKNYTIFDYIEFNTKKEAENWIKSGETNFIKFMQIIQSVDANRRCSHTPYMGDYTQPWTDKRFCEYFGITGYIDDEHAEPNSEWEIILNTMKEYV